MEKSVGAKVWFISDGFWPTVSNGLFPSHESICVLNPGKKDANIEITLYFEDRDKIEGFIAVCKAERANHIRMDKIKNVNGMSVPRGVPYAMMVTSDTEVIVQYSRMDTTQAEMTLMTTMAYPVEK